MAEPLLNPSVQASQVETGTGEAAPAEEAKDPKKTELDERKGLMYMGASTSIGVLAQSITSGLFLAYPQLSMWQILVIRCGVSMLVGLLLMSRQKQGITD